jgi:predicted transporter
MRSSTPLGSQSLSAAERKQMSWLVVCIETVSWALNRLFYWLFNTTWSLIYLFTFWRNTFFVLLVAVALVVDWVRRDRDVCKRITLTIVASRPVVLAAVLSSLALFALIVVLLDAKAFSFASAYLHYQHATQYSDLLRARIVYVTEVTGVGFASLLLAFFSVRQSAGLVELKRVSRPENWHFRELWVTLAFLILASVVALMGVMSLESVPRPRTTYRPGSDIAILIMYALTPNLLAVGMKYWLMAGFVITTEEQRPRTN